MCTCLTVSSGPSGEPQDVMVMKYESGIRVTWRPPPNNKQNGPLTGYIVSIRVRVYMHVWINVHIRDCVCTCYVYCFHQIYITTLSNGNRTRYMVEGGSTTQHVISNISPGQYALRMSAVNTDGEGPLTQKVEDFTIC